MHGALLGSIDDIVAQGKAVVSGTDDEIVTLVKRVIEDDRSASFYLTRGQAHAIRDWYWTPQRIAQTGLQPISDEETARIRTELGVTGITDFRYAPMQCECGHTYGAFEFFQQGVGTHGPDAVNAVFSLKNSTLLQVNPTFVPVCPNCDRQLMRGELGDGEYEGPTYAGCCYPF